MKFVRKIEIVSDANNRTIIRINGKTIKGITGIVFEHTAGQYPTLHLDIDLLKNKSYNSKI